jgi:hypothetical protein
VTLKHKSDFVAPSWVDARYVRLYSHIDNLTTKIRRRRRSNLPSSELEAKCARLQNELDEYSRSKSQQHYLNLLSSGKVSAWKVINDLTGRNRNSGLPCLQRSDGKLEHMSGMIANMFNEYFGETVAQSSGPCPANNFLGPTTQKSMFIRHVSTDEIQSELIRLDVRKALGDDGIPARILKMLTNALAHNFSEFINYFFARGMFPDPLKIAKVVPLFKGGDKKMVENFRGISILPALSKVFESVLNEQLQSFLLANELHDPHQFGFRKNRGTSDAIASLLSSVTEELDKRLFVAVLFFDVRKAFDTVPHETLLNKLELIGVRGIANEIFRDYLKNRKQYVVVGTDKSDTTAILQGVPQGSILGPILFNVLVSDLRFLKTSSLKFSYADDLAVVCSHSDPEELANALKQDFLKVKQFYESNGLRVNPSKSKLLCFGKRDYSRAKSVLMNEGVECVDEFQYLGAAIDSDLNFQNFTDNLACKMISSCRALSIVRYCMPPQALWTFFHAFVNSHLLYCSFLLSRVSAAGIKRIQVLQKKALKLCFSLPIRFSSIELFKSYAPSVLPVPGIIYLSLLTMVKKALLTNETGLLEFTKIQSGRRQGQLVIPGGHLSCRTRDVMVLGPRLFNLLPVEVRNTTNLYHFKNSVKKSLLTNRVALITDFKIEGAPLRQSSQQ